MICGINITGTVGLSDKMNFVELYTNISLTIKNLN